MASLWMTMDEVVSVCLIKLLASSGCGRTSPPLWKEARMPPPAPEALESAFTQPLAYNVDALEAFSSHVSGPRSVLNFKHQRAGLNTQALDPPENRRPIAFAHCLTNQVLSFQPPPAKLSAGSTRRP